MANTTIDITTESYNMTHRHGFVRIHKQDIERNIHTELNLSVGPTEEQSAQEVAEEFTERLENLVREYAI